MQDLSIALVQTEQFWEDKEKNLQHIQELLTQLNDKVDVIVLPEMFDTGFSMNTDLANEWPRNDSLEMLINTARVKDAALYTSMMVSDNGTFRNRGVFVTEKGDVYVYDKRKSFGLGGEDQFFTPGEEEVIISYRGWNINLQICYDLRFPELIRNSEIEGKAAYDLLLYVANWPEKRSLHWKTLLCARAIENQSYVVGVNRVGTDGNQLTYSGDSLCCNPLGEIWECTPNRSEVRVVQLIYQDLQHVRKLLPFLKDR
jgi:predicted amidohydrolase